MGRLRHHLKHLERQTRGETITIVQRDGSVARFPTSVLEEAFLRNVGRLRGEDVPPHPLSVAIQNAAQRAPWHDSFFDMFEVSEEVQDLSEP